MKFLHIGIPSDHKLEDKNYLYFDKIKLHVTNPKDHELKLQFVWAEPDSPLPEIVKTENHVSIEVDHIEDELQGYDYVAYEPVALNDQLKVCFAVKDNVLFELMEYSN